MKVKAKIKIMAISIGLLIIVTLIVLGIMYFRARNEVDKSTNGLTTVEQELLTVTESYPTKFVVYGANIDFASSVHVSYIDEINDTSLKFDDNYSYQMIIINDLERNINLSDEEWGIINNIVKSDKRCNLFYLGSKEIEQIQKLGLISDITAIKVDDLSVGLVHEADELITVYGTYVVNAGYSLAEALIHEQVFSIKQSNQ